MKPDNLSCSARLTPPIQRRMHWSAVITRLSIVLIFIYGSLVSSREAVAACVSPPGNASELIYNAAAKQFQYCNDTNWIAAHHPGDGSGGCTNPVRDEGHMLYNSSARIYQGCAGDDWRPMGRVGGTPLQWQGITSRAVNSPSPNVNDYFGGSAVVTGMGGDGVAVSGTIAVVGTANYQPNSGAGRAYVFDTTSGSLISTLNNPSPNVTDRFGESVAVSGTVAVVGAYADESDGGTGVAEAGRAYVFDTSSGALITALNNPSPNTSDNFGSSVAVSGTFAVVGAERDESDGGAGVADAGRAYVFNTTTGALIATLDNPSPNANDRFGKSVAVSGTIAVVGADLDELDGGTGTTDSGRAYVFDITSGTLLATLNNPGSGASDLFGAHVAIANTLVVVGAPLRGAGDSGGAYVFDATTGTLVSTLSNPSPNNNDNFGNSVAISGTTALVASYRDQSGGQSGVGGAGRAYVFDTATGSLVSTIDNPTPHVDDWFGSSVALSGAVAVVGAERDESDGVSGVGDAGRAYIFEPLFKPTTAALNNPSANVDDEFGYSVAVSGTVAVVGAERDESDGGTGVSEAGRAYVFNTSTGTLITTLDNPSPNAGDRMGVSVAVSGTVAVVGARWDESDGGTGVTDAGRAYVFDATSGALIATLNNPTPNVNDYFGNSVAVSGTTAVVGANLDESDGVAGVGGAGRAYVFDTATGDLIATLNNPSPNGGDNFGVSVAVSGTTAVISADADESDGGAGVSSAGRAYVFDTVTGNLISTLNNPSPHVGDRFGNSVAVSGTVAVVGAHNDESDGGTGVSEAGRAYVFDTTTGNLIATLNNPSPNSTDNFGYSVAVSGTSALVGAYQDEYDGGTTTAAVNAGRAYVFDTTTGNLMATLNNPSRTLTDYFGNSVALSGPVAVVGAVEDESDGLSGVSNAGRAYVFNPRALGDCLAPLRSAGSILFNSSFNVMQYCDGANWVRFGL